MTLDLDKMEEMLKNGCNPYPSPLEILKLIRLARLAQEWVSVEERLPEERIAVWVYEGFHPKEGFFGASDSLQMDKVWRTTNGVPMKHTVTHWMPLPAPPATAEKEKP